MDSNPVDRISELPDPILGNILSFLPIKNAVGTCILSTRWKNVFPFDLPPVKLDLDDSAERNDESCTSFVVFVDKLLNETLRDVSCLDKFILKCTRNCGDAKFVSWICAAVRVNVREIQLECILTDSRGLFLSLNGCTTLTRLELKGGFKFIPLKFSIPNLKTLDICNVIFNDDDYYELYYDDDDDDEEEVYGSIMKSLMNSFPSLEELSLFECDFEDVEMICIESDLLKKLDIQNSLGLCCGLMILTPNLEVLLVNDCVANSYWTRFDSLRWAHIDVGPSEQQSAEFSDDEEENWYPKAVTDLVNGCRKSMHLYLATCSMEYLHRSAQHLLPFQNLTLLYLACLNGSHGWAFLASILGSAPCLQKLTLEEGFNYYEDGYSNFNAAVSSRPLLCLESHLKEVEMWVFHEEEDEIKLIEYFLENGKVLQSLKLYCSPLKNMSTMERFCMLPEALMVIFGTCKNGKVLQKLKLYCLPHKDTSFLWRLICFQEDQRLHLVEIR